MKIIKWSMQLIVLAFIIYLILYNQTKVTFIIINDYWIIRNVPIVILCFIFLIIGFILCGFLYLINSFKLKLKINALNKEIQELTKINEINNIKE